MLLVPYMILIPLIAAFLVPLFGRRVWIYSQTLALTASTLLCGVSLAIAGSVLKEKIIVYKVGGHVPPIGITLFVDGLSSFIMVVVNFAFLLILAYSVTYTKQYTDRWKYFSLSMLALAGVNGVLVTGDIFNLYVFLEIASLAIYALIAFTTERDALEGAFKYAVMSSVASSFVLLGIALLYGFTATLSIADIGKAALTINSSSKVINFVSVLFLMGFGLKAALAPFHAWMPDAYSKAPASVAAMSSGAVIKVLGIYVLARLFFNMFGLSPEISSILTFLAAMSMIIGSIMSFGQTNIRRVLAYSGITQIGFIILGLGIGTPLSIVGGLLHLFNHSVSKVLLFMTSGVMERYFKTMEMKKMRSFISKSPVTGCANLSALLSMCGVPPFAGFWSKLIIIFACIQTGHPVLAFIAVAASMATLGYYFTFFTPILFGASSLPEDGTGIFKPTFVMNAVMVLLAVIAVFGGALLLPNAGNALLNSATTVLTNGIGCINSICGVMK